MYGAVCLLAEIDCWEKLIFRRIDDVVRARTTWTRAASENKLPFWGEAFHLADLPSFSTCGKLTLSLRGFKLMSSPSDIPSE